MMQSKSYQVEIIINSEYVNLYPDVLYQTS
jgi:hypothetical protein